MSSLMVRAAFAAAFCAVSCARAGKAPLPSVDTVLTKANSKAHDFAQQSAAMQLKFKEQQEQGRIAIHKQKLEYESILQDLSNQSQAISRQNAELQMGNSKLDTMNTEMEADLKKLSERNVDMRFAIQNISSNVAAAHLFLENSLKVTDDSAAKELEVLLPATPKPTLDHFLAVTNSDKLSLLAVAAKHTAGPEELVSILSASLAEIATAEKEGVAELKAHFEENFEQATAHLVELNATHASLVQRQAALKEKRAKLLEARSRLEATSKELHERLRAVRTFAGNIDGAVLSSLHGPANTTSNTTAAASAKSPKANTTQAQKANTTQAQKANTTQAQKANTTQAQKANTTQAQKANVMLAQKVPPAPVLASSNKSAKANVSANVSASKSVTPKPESVSLRRAPAKAASTRSVASKSAPLDNPLEVMKKWLSSKLR